MAAAAWGLRSAALRSRAPPFVHPWCQPAPVLNGGPDCALRQAGPRLPSSDDKPARSIIRAAYYPDIGAGRTRQGRGARGESTGRRAARDRFRAGGKPCGLVWRRRADAALLLAPALCNGFPLLQHDTGGYGARWFEGYLVPSRPAAYGLLLAATTHVSFWPLVMLLVPVLAFRPELDGLRRRWATAWRGAVGAQSLRRAD